jgi:hypothetical protein
LKTDRRRKWTAREIAKFDHYVATGAIDPEFIREASVMNSVPKAVRERIIADIKAKNDGEFTVSAVQKACEEWVAKRKEEEWRRLMNGLLSVVRRLVNRQHAEFPLEFTLSCAKGFVGRLLFYRVGDKVRLRKSEEAPDAPEDASVFPLLLSCVDARGKKFRAVMKESK